MAQTRQVYQVGAWLGASVEDIARSVNFALQSIGDRLDKIEGWRGNPEFESPLIKGAVPRARTRRAYAEDTTSAAGLTVSLGDVVVGDIIELMVNGRVTLNAGADGLVSYTISNQGTAIVKNAGVVDNPIISVTTTTATAGPYYFADSIKLIVTTAGSTNIGVTSRAVTGGTISTNIIRIAAECLIGV